MHMDTCSEERRRKKEKFKRKSQKEFDSTPGTCTLEHSRKGPKRLKMATVNVRGVTGKDDGIDKTRKLLRWVNTNNLDALFVQEHNGDHSKVNEWKDMCERSGYSIVHGLHLNDTNGSGRGAAILLSADENNKI